jgi:hypothetical protein
MDSSYVSANSRRRQLANTPGGATPVGTPGGGYAAGEYSAVHDIAYGEQTASLAAQQDAAAANFQPIYPMNLDITQALLKNMGGLAGDAEALDATVASASQMPLPSDGPSVDVGPDNMLKLQMDVADYVDNLDNVLRNMFAEPNAKLHYQLKQAEGTPPTFSYFATQKKMMRLTGDLNAASERALLTSLATTLGV